MKIKTNMFSQSSLNNSNLPMVDQVKFKEALLKIKRMLSTKVIVHQKTITIETFRHKRIMVVQVVDSQQLKYDTPLRLAINMIPSRIIQEEVMMISKDNMNNSNNNLHNNRIENHISNSSNSSNIL